MDTIQKIQGLLSEKEIKPAAMCKYLGFSSGLFTQWKQGKQNPKLDKLQSIADYLEVDIDYLLDTPLPYCPLCGQGYNKDDQKDVKYHNQMHKKWQDAVDEFGFCWPYKVRESIKHRSKRIVENKSIDLNSRYFAALNVMKSYFSRSLEASAYDLSHPNFHDYVGMLMNQEYWKKYLGNDVYCLLNDSFNPLPGMSEGTTYHLNNMPGVKEKPTLKKGEQDVSFDDFTYAFLDESKELTEENKAKLLEMAKFFKQQQDKENQ